MKQAILPGMLVSNIPLNDLSIGDEVYDRASNRIGKIDGIDEIDGYASVRFIDKSNEFTDNLPNLVLLSQRYSPAPVAVPFKPKTKNVK